MKLLFFKTLFPLFFAATLIAQTMKPLEKPLQSLPYAPSLDISAMNATVDAWCAGLNRHEAENERVLQERNSEPS